MADITMCGNSEECPVKHLCYRNTAPKSEYWQSYADFYKGEPYGCADYVEVRDEKRI